MRRTRTERRHEIGFTLVELTVSLALIGLLAMAAIPLLRVPLEGWMDATRRSTLTTEMDLIHTKLRDDMARALPGSVRVRTLGGRRLLEYLEVRASGTYRAVPPASGPLECPTSCSGTVGANDVLESGCADSCFVNLSPWENGPPVLAGTDWVVVNPTGAISPHANGANRIRTPALAVTANGRVNMAPHNFATPSPRQRFYIVTGPVSYECNPATRRLTRYWNYGIAPAQPAAFNGAASATLSTRVQGCELRYQDAGMSNRGGVVNAWLRLGNALTKPGSPETADLQVTVAVSEGP